LKSSTSQVIPRRLPNRKLAPRLLHETLPHDYSNHAFHHGLVWSFGHYHEITELADLLDNVKNENVAVREWKDQVIFMHKIVPGRTDKSYGIHVARLAGIPKKVLARSSQILVELESNFSREAHLPQIGGRLRSQSANRQPSLFDNLDQQTPQKSQTPNEPNKPDPILEKLRNTDLDTITPLQSINLLQNLINQLNNNKGV